MTKRKRDKDSSKLRGFLASAEYIDISSDFLSRGGGDSDQVDEDADTQGPASGSEQQAEKKQKRRRKKEVKVDEDLGDDGGAVQGEVVVVLDLQLRVCDCLSFSRLSQLDLINVR